MHFLKSQVLASTLAVSAGLLPASATNSSPVVSAYESGVGCCGPLPAWLVPHSGVDFSGQFGEDVIAPADGIVVTHWGANPLTCGNTVAIHHAEFSRYTVFCHFQDVSVQIGQRIRRGEKIGTLGDSGVAGDCRRAGRPCAIVHMELNVDGRGHPKAIKGVTFDVLEHSVGCFDSRTTYPTDRLALTYPVQCQNQPAKAAVGQPNLQCANAVSHLTSRGADGSPASPHH